jgi:hypothetical protein
MLVSDVFSTEGASQDVRGLARTQQMSPGAQRGERRSQGVGLVCCLHKLALFCIYDRRLPTSRTGQGLAVSGVRG